MAVVTQTVTPTRTYQPFEGMTEAARLWSAVPRGMLHFDAEVSLTAKPINDSYDLQVTSSLPDGFAHVFSSMSVQLVVDTASDLDAVATVRVFNGLPSAAPANTQFAAVTMTEVPSTVALGPSRILSYSLGDLREWFPGPIVRHTGAAGLSILFNTHNSAAAAAAEGAIFFHLSVYQYELNQAVRFPLNFPIPVGRR